MPSMRAVIRALIWPRESSLRKHLARMSGGTILSRSACRPSGRASSERELEDQDRRAEHDDEPDGLGGVQGEERDGDVEQGGKGRVLELIMAVLGPIEGFPGPDPLPGLVIHLEVHHAPAPPSDEKDGAQGDDGEEKGERAGGSFPWPFQPSRGPGDLSIGPAGGGDAVRLTSAPGRV